MAAQSVCAVMCPKPATRGVRWVVANGTSTSQLYFAETATDLHSRLCSSRLVIVRPSPSARRWSKPPYKRRFTSGYFIGASSAGHTMLRFPARNTASTWSSPLQTQGSLLRLRGARGRSLVRFRDLYAATTNLNALPPEVVNSQLLVTL